MISNVLSIFGFPVYFFLSWPVKVNEARLIMVVFKLLSRQILCFLLDFFVILNKKITWVILTPQKLSKCNMMKHTSVKKNVHPSYLYLDCRISIGYSRHMISSRYWTIEICTTTYCLSRQVQKEKKKVQILDSYYNVTLYTLIFVKHYSK